MRDEPAAARATAQPFAGLRTCSPAGANDWRRKTAPRIPFRPPVIPASAGTGRATECHHAARTVGADAGQTRMTTIPRVRTGGPP